MTIEKLVYGGDGLARLEGEDGRRKTLFVPLVLPGERVDVAVVEERQGFAKARLERVIDPAAERTSPPCPYFGECGGCHYQHATYEAQLKFKEQILRETVARIAKVDLPKVVVHGSPPLNYRNRTRMRIGKDGDGKFAIGYYRMGTHTLFPVRECPISSPLINRAIQTIWSVAATHDVPQGLAEIEFFADHDDRRLLVEFLVDATAKEGELRKFAQSLNSVMPEVAGAASLRRGVEEHEEVAAPELDSPSRNSDQKLIGEAALKYRVGSYEYRVSAGAFFQSNRFLTEVLVQLATAGVTGKRTLDLYAGVGLFTLPLAAVFERVTAVEASPASYGDLCANAPANVRAIDSTTEAFLAKLSGSKPDFVVLDPPRSGLGKRVSSALAKIAPASMAYVSCDPSTLARDLPTLLAAGFKISQAHLVDLFPQTFHIETVLRLER